MIRIPCLVLVVVALVGCGGQAASDPYSDAAMQATTTSIVATTISLRVTITSIVATQDARVRATQMAIGATLTAKPPSTPRPANSSKSVPTVASSVSGSGYVPLLGRLFVGVKIYYGAQKTYGFEAVGGSENCPSMPSGRGVLVRYPDGTQEWKDRMNLVDSSTYFVKSNDPNATSFQWVELPGCH